MVGRRIYIVLFGIIFFTANIAFGMDFKPGIYEITSSMEMPGMSMPAQTITQCLTSDEPVPSQSMGESGCKMIEMKRSKNTVTWKMECRQQGQVVTTQGKITYSNDSFSGSTVTRTGPQAGNMTITTKMSGKRISACK